MPSRKRPAEPPPAIGKPTCMWCGYRGEELDFHPEARPKEGGAWMCRDRKVCTLEWMRESGYPDEMVQRLERFYYPGGAPKLEDR